MFFKAFEVVVPGGAELAAGGEDDIGVPGDTTDGELLIGALEDGLNGDEEAAG